MAMSKFSKSFTALPSSVRKNPQISFVSKVKKMDTDADKSECIKLEFFMDPDNPASGCKYSRQFDISKDGCNTQRSESSG
jgi:hypothetical protein